MIFSSIVIDCLRSKYENEDVGIAYFYFEHAESQAQTPAFFARAMLRQLSSQIGGLIPSAVSDFYQRTKNDVRDQAWFLELQGVLHRVASTFSQCFFVIDAFDETDARDHRAGLLEVLTNLRLRAKCRIFASTRPHIQNVEKAFDGSMISNVSADSTDLETFLSSLIDSHPDAEYLMDGQLKAEIITKLCENSRGM